MEGAEALIVKQRNIFELMNKTIRNYKKDSVTRKTKEYLNLRIKTLSDYWAEFNRNHFTILSLGVKDDDPYVKDDFWSEVESFYIQNTAEIQAYMNKTFPLSTTSQTVSQISTNLDACQTSNLSVKLPQIQLPVFSGQYEDWVSFRDLFQSMIHEKDELSPVQKFYYLKAHVRGEAERLIKHFNISNDNYTSAWDLLKGRYDNTRALVNVQLKRLFSQSKIVNDTAQNVKNLYDNVLECVSALTNLKVPVEHWDAILVYLIVQRLSNESIELWERSLSSKKDIPSFTQIKAFLEERFRTLEAVGDSTRIQSKPTLNIKTKQARALNAVKLSCVCCQGEHSLNRCTEFRNKSPVERLEFVKTKHVCFNCLSFAHSIKQCTSKGTCFICHKRHHTQLHEAVASSPPPQTSNPKEVSGFDNKPDLVSHLMQSKPVRSTVLLSTAVIKVSDSSGREVSCLAILDQGSQSTLISESLLQRLSPKVEPTSTQILGVGNSKVQNCKKIAIITIKNFESETVVPEVKALVLKSLSIYANHLKHQATSWQHIKGLKLADPNYARSGKIEIILGADVYPDIIIEGIVKGPKNTPMAQNTRFGWILMGPVSLNHGETNVTTSTIRLVSMHCILDLQTQIRKFWELEEIPSNQLATPEDDLCEKIFVNTCTKENKRFIVHLPFKPNSPPLGESRSIAVRQFNQFQKRFDKDQRLKLEYSNCINEYIRLNQMETVKPSEIKLEIDNLGYHGYYLPHHAVYKEESSTTKFRVVFNGSQKSLSGVSLNDKLLVGPNIQENMTSILLRWRFFRIAFSADIEKMYRQVKIHYPHTDFQRIIWRESKLNPLQDYRLLTVTFGIDCSAYLAIRVLKKLAADEKIKFPIGSNVLENDFYVDNLLSGADNACKAIEKRDQLMSLLKEGSFTLRKWVCNQESVLAGIPNEFREVKEPKFVNLDTPVKALGLYWSPQTDEFQYKVKFSPRTDSPTKRTILSDISKLFDPLGWISPVIVKGKMIMQSLWLSGLNWDAPITEEILNQWINFTAQFSRLEDIRIPRWINYLSTYNCVEIHVFSDASNQAFCAALYIRLKENDRWISHLLIAKTRIAPLKPISLPRLELCGALLAAKLTSQILSSLAVSVQTIYAWTDSTIVLSWLKGHPSKWKTFVSNRVAEIQELSKNIRWNYTPSSSNPADLGTRGISSTELLKSSLWFSGPKWLSSNQDTWPKQYDYDSTTMEQKRVSLHSSIQSVEITDILKRYSSITKLNRIIAYCVRFIKNCKLSKIDRNVNYLSADELKRALVLIIKLDQAQYFSEEIANLKDGKGLSTKSKILSLTPFLDHQGILRVGGRLKNSNLSYHEIHPIILSNQSNIATLLIRKAHLDTLHGGCQLIMRKLRERYWILNLRRTVRKLIHNCIACYRQKATAAQQLMGNLPYPRITPSRPFTHTGVDYCGPFEIKQHKGRNAKITKCYVSLFICLSVKAIHLELVSDLTTEAFLAAFKRFCARRGLCSHVYSDQGTNFKGASTVIKNDFKRAIKDAEREVAEILANDEITWHFIPPSSPHFGGLWEAGVKSVKFHLRRIVKSLNFTFEEMYTLLAQIEATLNSRPLCPLNSDPEDVSPLTPNHFLIGGSTSSPPEPTLLDVAENRLNRWQRIQKVHQNFWQSWKRDYLNRLHTRPKWLQTKTNVEKNQLVLLKDERLPPNKWLLGRIVETHPGKDGLTRVVTLRTKDSFLIRPITKLCVLPSNS